MQTTDISQAANSLLIVRLAVVLFHNFVFLTENN